MKNRNEVILNGRCYNFALGLVQERLLKEKCWTADKAIKLSDGLSKEVKKTVARFFTRKSR